MSSLFQTVVHDHDLRFVALAVGICALGSLTASAIAQHALKPEAAASRRGWLAFAGLVTGLVVWTTHFTAMLGYRNDLDIRYDLATATVSILLAIPIAMAGWLVGFGKRERGIAAGVFIGLSIAVAHFLDMLSLRVAGTIEHDHLRGLLAIGLGLAIGGYGGHLFCSFRKQILAWPTAIALFSAVLVLHFTAMSGVRIVPDGRPLAALDGTATPDQLANIVVGAFLALLAAAIAFTWHAERLARATADEHDRLIQALEDLRRSEDHHRAYVELNPQIAWVADPQGIVTEIAPLWAELVGMPREHGVGKGWAQAVHPDDLPGVIDVWQRVVATGDSDRADVRYRIRLHDGSYRWFRARARPRCDEEGRIIAWYGSLEDIHDQVLAEIALRASEERYRLASRATNDVIWDWSFERQRANWAGAHKKVLGYPELQGQTELNWWLDRIHPDDRPRVLASQAAALDGGAEYWTEEYRFRIVSGDWIDVRSRCVIVRDDDGQPKRLVGSMLDITQQKNIEAELNWAAYHDPLSRLPNRSLFNTRLRSAIEAARTGNRFVGLISLDLNDFKEFNDTLGHAAGDRVLVETGQRLVNIMPPNATVARLGGDEFAIILPDLESADTHGEAAHAISSCLVEPVVLEGMRIPISYCAGIAVWPRDGLEPEELLIAADLALYAAKAEMPGTIRAFDPSMREASERRTRMLNVARQALDEDRIIPFYQPKIDLQSGEIMGWEALLRVRQDDGTVLSPAAIAAAFDDAEITVKLTDRMFDRMFADLAVWRAAGIEPGRIAVNVSAGDFRLGGLADRLQSAAVAHGQSLAEIDIEVTEGVLIGQLGPEVARMLEELRTMGVMVALDDFGTGYASLTHLQQFPVDVIKIDKSFVDRLGERGAKASAVVDAVLQMARRLGMQTVAEGVETREQARYLRVRGCTIGQGYFFCHPVCADEVPSLLASRQFECWELARTGGLPA